MKKKTLTYALLTAIMSPVLAKASTETDTRWYVAPFGTYVMSDDDRRSDDGWGGGFAIGKMINEHFNLELKGFYQDFGKKAAPFFPSQDIDVGGGTIDLQYYFMRDKFSPYAVIGAGAASSSGAVGSRVGFIGEAGAGFTYEIMDHLLFRSDIRYRYNSDAVGGYDATALGGATAASGDFHDMTVNVGFVIPLGEKAAKPAPKVEMPVAKPAPDCSTFDDDHDGVNNCIDQCPGTIAGSQVDKYGCPIRLEIHGVQFKYDSAELTDSAKSILNGVAKSLIAYPQKNDLEVQGHTSSEGSDQYNLKLSQRRSQSVANYLKSQGVKNKLTAHGYGETHPIADNSNETGRSRNRRVELIWLP